jgi:uncharacterized protein YfiM (DUF2279 family)
MFMKKQFYIFALVVFLLSSCKENEVIVNEISKETEQQINNIISVLKTNNSVVSQIRSSNISQQQRVSANGETPTIDNETQSAIDAFIENPHEFLVGIAMEENGAAKIDLLESIYMQEDKEIIMEKLLVFVPADSIALIESNANQSSLAPLRVNSNPFIANSFTPSLNVSIPTDAKLHIMAGAAAAMGAATLVYVFAKWFSFEVKVASLVIVGISAAVLFGAAKEYYDHRSDGVVEWRDFWNTLIGGVVGVVVTWAIYKAFSNPTTAGVVTGVAAIIVGTSPLKELISIVKERA